MLNDPSSTLNPEEKLLLSLCRLEFSEEQRAESAEMMKGVRDWDRFVKLANEHGITAITARNINHPELRDLIPAETFKLLEGGRMQSMIRNTWLTGRWKQVNTILSEAGIKHLLLKGMALEHTVYGSTGLRQMNDVDILVRKDEVMKAWLLLQAHDFKSDMIKSPLHRKILADTGKHMPTLRKDGFPVEIHHRLFLTAHQNDLLDKAIDDAVEIRIEGSPAYVPDDDIHLEFLKSHYQYHLSLGDFQLRLWLDIELLSPGSAPAITEEMIRNPHSPSVKRQSREHYRKAFLAMPKSARTRYLAGDIFPSLKWMTTRHGCGTLKALFYYPQRVGKLFWLI